MAQSLGCSEGADCKGPLLLQLLVQAAPATLTLTAQ